MSKLVITGNFSVEKVDGGFILEHTAAPVDDDMGGLGALGLFAGKMSSRQRKVLSTDAQLFDAMSVWLESMRDQEAKLNEKCEECGQCDDMLKEPTGACTGDDTCMCLDCLKKLEEEYDKDNT